MWKMSKKSIRMRNRKNLFSREPKLRRRKRICISRYLKSKKGSKEKIFLKNRSRIQGKNLLTLQFHLTQQTKNNLPLLKRVQISRWIPSKPETQKKNTLTYESINKMCQRLTCFSLKHRNSLRNVKKNLCKTLVSQQGLLLKKKRK